MVSCAQGLAHILYGTSRGRVAVTVAATYGVGRPTICIDF